MSDCLLFHGLYSPWNSLGQNTGVGSLSLLQGIFATQGSDPGLPHCRQILYQLSHKGSPWCEGAMLCLCMCVCWLCCEGAACACVMPVSAGSVRRGESALGLLLPLLRQSGENECVCGSYSSLGFLPAFPLVP